jgi:sensor histidine kinase YesM
VRYQWKLDGFEDEWSPMSEKTDATYSNIPPGDYTFMVRACNADLVWSEPESVSFSTLPPFWKTWWFNISMIVLGILVVTVIFRIRVRRVTELAQQEQERLKMEKDMVRLEQKALRLQMNPHFIFNALNSIQGLIGTQDNKTARYYLAKFSKLMRLTLENSRDQRIPLDNEIRTLDNYMSLERFSSGEQFDFNIECTDDLDPEELMIPPMMIQPFVENAIIHGVSKIEHHGQIHVLFECKDDKIICSISDNGIGRKKAAEVKSQKENHHKSTALVVTQERLDILNIGGNGQKSLEIVDLYHDDGAAAGTKIMIRIPLLEG